MKTTALKGKKGIRLKDNGKFIVTKYFSGERKTREFLTIKEAEAWKNDESGFDFTVNGKNPSLSGQGEGREIFFRDVVEQYRIEGMMGLTEYTRYKKELRMKRFLPGLYKVRMSEMNSRAITKHLKDMQLIVDDGSRRCNFDKELKDLAAIFNWYHRAIQAFKNPVTKDHYKEGSFRAIRKKKKDLPLHLISHAISFMDEPFKSLALIQFLLGVRIGEAAALNTHTVNFKTGKIDISESIVWMKGKPNHVYETKTGKVLEKEITPQVREILQEMNAKRPKGCQFFFHRKGKPLRYGLILNNFNKALERAGLDNYSGTHFLRHSLATHVRNEAGLDVAQAALGHTTSRQTERYARLDANKKVTAEVIKIENYLRESQPSRNHEERSVM